MSVPAFGSYSGSVFTGADIAATAGMRWHPGAARPKFEDQVWSLAGWADAPIQMKPTEKTWDFAEIRYPGWQLVAKELALAWLASRDERVLALPRARRIPRHPRTIWARLYHLRFWLNWLHERRIHTLASVTQDHCTAFLHEYGFVLDKNGDVIRPKAPNGLRTVVSAMQEIADYGDLLHGDRYHRGFRPWGTTSPREVVGAPARPDFEAKTAPLPDEVLAPLLTACLQVIDVLGPHILDLRQALREERRKQDSVPLVARSLHDAGQLRDLLDRRLAIGEPLPEQEKGAVKRRLQQGWDPQDPLLRLNFRSLLRPAGHRDIARKVQASCRPMLEDAVARLGVAHLWGRDAALVPRADTGELVPWTLPLPALAADAVARIGAHACLVTTSALTGMRSSELMELAGGCRRPMEETAPGLGRHLIAGKVIKGRRWGGEADEWVVLDEVFRAIGLAEQLNDVQPGQSIFGHFQFDYGAIRWLRRWVNSPAGQRLGLSPIPDEPIHPRRLRRTLALEMAARPGGLLAAKVHFKHLTVVTTEGYAHRPGGAQAVFHHEWKTAEAKEKLARTVEVFRQFQEGRLPAGPGAEALLASFRSVEEELAQHDAGPAKAVSDRQIELLLKGKAATLHLGVANYCWFEDPAKALCLKLAGAKSASAPLTGMCDSGRCPQATHHIGHRQVWQSAADNATALLASPRIPPGEKTRLRAEHERAQRILEEIDKARGEE
ncbi:hypothetical protein [Kitasatospora purpeofusca]|uniref:hypothetical protein n=1 Tax=Kitasatospora purpeofusca TaxID=67352 RepID=UPI0036D25FC5